MRVARALVDGVATWIGWIPSADAGAWHPIEDPYAAFALDADPAPIGDALDRYFEYAEREIAAGTRLRALTRHLMGAFAGRPGGRHWRRMLSEIPRSEDDRATLAALRELAWNLVERNVGYSD